MGIISWADRGRKGVSWVGGRDQAPAYLDQPAVWREAGGGDTLPAALPGCSHVLRALGVGGVRSAAPARSPALLSAFSQPTGLAASLAAPTL